MKGSVYSELTEDDAVVLGRGVDGSGAAHRQPEHSELLRIGAATDGLVERGPDVGRKLEHVGGAVGVGAAVATSVEGDEVETGELEFAHERQCPFDVPSPTVDQNQGRRVFDFFGGDPPAVKLLAASCGEANFFKGDAGGAGRV